MSEEKIQQYIKDTVTHAKDSLLNENSNLVDMIVHKMEGHIEKAIDKHVNGKIRALDSKIDNYIALDLQWKKEDEQWKEDVKPQIQLVKDTQGFGRVTLGFLAFVTAIGGAILLVYNLFKLK
jgi:hypothetical protein